MKKIPSGFSLIELIVVMAIVSLLTTAGVAAYTGYLRNVRDTRRITDIAALDTIILDYRRITGKYPVIDEFDTVVTTANNGQMIRDPLDGQIACISSPSDSTPDYCTYLYYNCDNGEGYTLSAKFETLHNAQKYTSLSNEGAWYYHVGYCTELDIPSTYDPIVGTCKNKTECPLNNVCVGPRDVNGEKYCREKNNVDSGKNSYCDFNDDCASDDCNENSHKCK